MKYSFVIGAFAVAAHSEPIPQAVTSAIAPPAAAPAGCSPSSPSSFEVTVVKVPSTKRSVEKRQESGPLTLKLSDGVLTDQAGRTGYIASNYQFQFDAPPQAGAIYTSGYSLCSNSSLALGGSAIFYECLSGGFYNLYDRSWAAQCSPIYIVAMPTAAAAQTGESATPVTQITDGQPQGPTPAPISEKSEGQPVATSAAPAVSEKSEGQPVATSAAPAVSEKSEGQPVATSAAPAVSEKSEGQPVATSAAPAVSEKSEGQPVATSAASAVSEKSEGQPVVTSAAPTVPVKSGGEPVITSAVQATSSSATTSATPSVFTGAAATPVHQVGALAAGILGFFAVL